MERTTVAASHTGYSFLDDEDDNSNQRARWQIGVGACRTDPEAVRTTFPHDALLLSSITEAEVR